MLLYYKLHRVKKLVDATTDEICKYLRHFNGSEQLSLELNHEHILKIRNYVLGDYLNTSVSFFRLYSDRKLLDKIISVFTPTGENISKTIFENELFSLKKEFENHEEKRKKEESSWSDMESGFELLISYLDNLCHEQNNYSNEIENEGLVGDIECVIPYHLHYSLDEEEGTFSVLISCLLNKFNLNAPVI